MGGFRAIGARSSVTATARLFTDRAGPAASPLLLSPAGGASFDTRARRDRAMGDPYSTPPDVAASDAGGQAVTAYTLGTTAIVQGDRWTHSLVLGLDGYRLSSALGDPRLTRAAADSAILSARGAADRASMRASSTLRLGGGGPVSGSLARGFEHSALSERLVESGGGSQPALYSPARDAASLTPAARSNSGVYAQTNVSLLDALYITGGLRLEHSTGGNGFGRYAVLPMFGAALVRESGDVSVKLRAAYGKGIRTPRTEESLLAARDARRAWISQATLAPEQQSGIEAGIDVTVGRALSAQITRFDQIASGLVQRVTLGSESTSFDGRDARRALYGLQNVGEISNRGWEMQATLGGPRLSLSGALSLVDSRVRRVAVGYTGDLLPGDRMLEVPSRTASLTASWRSSLFDGSMTVARASDWINYDRLALAGATAAGDVTGLLLRDYWRRYPGVTRLRATGSRVLRPGLSLRLTGENLLGEQRGEPDDAVILPGRSMSAGVEVKF
jgi:iron complex outermembrane receptor protein